MLTIRSSDELALLSFRYLPREVDPLVYNMSIEDPGSINYNQVGGLGEQVRELREVIELPLINPELFQRVGINPPKGVLLYGPPGTGKTLLARAVASQLDANFLKVPALSMHYLPHHMSIDSAAMIHPPPPPPQHSVLCYNSILGMDSECNC